MERASSIRTDIAVCCCLLFIVRLLLRFVRRCEERAVFEALWCLGSDCNPSFAQHIFRKAGLRARQLLQACNLVVSVCYLQVTNYFSATLFYPLRSHHSPGTRATMRHSTSILLTQDIRIFLFDPVVSVCPHSKLCLTPHRENYLVRKLPGSRRLVHYRCCLTSSTSTRTSSIPQTHLDYTPSL
jgi:hypothetical protein